MSSTSFFFCQVNSQYTPCCLGGLPSQITSRFVEFFAKSVSHLRLPVSSLLIDYDLLSFFNLLILPHVKLKSGLHSGKKWLKLVRVESAIIYGWYHWFMEVSILYLSEDVTAFYPHGSLFWQDACFVLASLPFSASTIQRRPCGWRACCLEDWAPRELILLVKTTFFTLQIEHFFSSSWKSDTVIGWSVTTVCMSSAILSSTNASGWKIFSHIWVPTTPV